MEDLNLLLARLTSMDDSIEDMVDEEAEDGEESASLLVDEADSDAPIIKLVHSIVAQAVQQGASDIHVNPEEGDTRVLFRVDGVLAPAATVKRKMAMGGGGKADDKPGLIDGVRSGHLNFLTVDTSDEALTVFGDWAISTGLADITAEFGGKPRTLQNRYSLVWMKRGDAWKIVHWHTTVTK